MKCRFCNGENFYLKITSHSDKYVCKDCEDKIKYLRESGLTDQQAEKVLKGENK